MQAIICREDDNVYRIVESVVKARGESLSNFTRRAIRRELARLGYMSDDDRKALEVE